MKTLTFSETVPLRGHYDVAVAGGGVAGVAAALAARRAGKRVLLVEKTMLLGGLATIGLINYFVPMCNGRGSKIIYGMADELLELSIKYGYDSIPKEWRDGEPGQGKTNARYVTRYSPYIFALAMTDLLVREGIDILFDCIVANVVMDDKHCRGLILENKSGREFYGAGVIIDCTGDADVLHRAGIPTVQGRNFFTYIGKTVTLESCQAAVEAQNIQKAFGGCSGGGANLYGGNHPEDMPFFSGTSVEDVNDYLIKNQLLMFSKLKKQDRLSREVAMLPTMAQFRTTRRIDGDYTLTVADQYRHFDDSIGAICDFEQRDYLYEVPYRVLTRKGYDNLLTAGRSASGDGYGWDILRVIPPAILTGQAAGLAAAQALDSKQAITDISLPTLQQELAASQVIIHFDDALIPEPGTDSKVADNNGHI
jgi:hypothetical protein